MNEATSIAEIMDQMGITMKGKDLLTAWEEVIWTAYPCWFAWRTRLEANKIKRQTRDGQSCIKCGRTEKMTLHHIMPVKIGGGNSEENLARLCKTCHRAVHAKKAYGRELFDAFMREKDIDDPTEDGGADK